MSEDDESILREEIDFEEPETPSDAKSSENEGTESTTTRHSTRVSKQPDFYGVCVNSVNSIAEPLTVKQALTSSEKENWQEAMKDEFNSLDANNFDHLVVAPASWCHHQLIENYQ